MSQAGGNLRRFVRTIPSARWTLLRAPHPRQNPKQTDSTRLGKSPLARILPAAEADWKNTREPASVLPALVCLDRCSNQFHFRPCRALAAGALQPRVLVVIRLYLAQVKLRELRVDPQRRPATWNFYVLLGRYDRNGGENSLDGILFVVLYGRTHLRYRNHRFSLHREHAFA